MRCSPNTFTIFLQDGVMDVHELLDFDPAARIQSLRSMLNRLGADVAEGFIFACIHGEYDPTTGLFHVHVHGLAGGEMLEVVSSVRNLPDYRTNRGEAPMVKVGRKPLSNLPYPLTYIVQSSWPRRWRAVIDGVPRRGKKGRIPEPYHTAQLLWLDRWSLRDITLMMGMYVGRNGLVLNNR